MTEPASPIAAVTHPDPYPYYAALVRDRPFHRDATLGLWVAASAEAVTAVLSSPHCRVRPAREPVPEPLRDTPVGDVFKLLVRQTDGPRHGPMKATMSAALAALESPLLPRLGAESAQALAAELELSTHRERLADFAFRMSVSVVARMIGVSEAQHARLAGIVARVVPGFAPGSAPGTVAAAQFAVRDLLDLMGEIARNPAGLPEPNALSALLASGATHGVHDPALLLANALGLFTQSYDATGGLIGNTLLLLAERLDLAAGCRTDRALLERTVAEAARFDSPVQNTRRFVGERTTIVGVTLEPDDAILVLLAAANRDPAANPEPERFDPDRNDPRLFTFGVGVHACPGERFAVSIAAAGVAEVLRSGIDLAPLRARRAYRPSANGRLPTLQWS